MELVKLEPRAEQNGLPGAGCACPRPAGPDPRERRATTPAPPTSTCARRAHERDYRASLSEDDRRSFVHHPDWKAVIGNLLDTLMRLGRREEALGYLVPLGVGVCEVEPARPRAESEPDDRGVATGGLLPMCPVRTHDFT